MQRANDANTLNRRQGPTLWWRWETLIEVAAAAYGILAVIVLWVSNPAVLRSQHLVIAIAVTPACILAPVGGWWAVYQCIRYEKQPWKYVALVVLIPLGFVWYYFERYSRREPSTAAG
jgi:hypothetical protein